MRGQEGLDAVITFRANARLIAEAEALAASEGISRSDVARRALLRDLDRSRHLIGEPTKGPAGRVQETSALLKGKGAAQDERFRTSR